MGGSSDKKIKVKNIMNSFLTNEKESRNNIYNNLEDAKKQWLAAALENGYEIPEPDSLEDYSGQFKLRIPKTLHRELAEKSKQEGISMNQYCMYLLSKNSGLPIKK
jgi:predicted HicB family RNase H-like nuclease